jgi:5'-nucleotidase
VTEPLILLSNDDGYHSRGLLALRTALSAFGRVIVVAPETEQSASSHALSLHRPLRIRNPEPDVFAVDGTPADCVYLALYSKGRVLPRLPDLVVSGINRGLNLGQDVFYSGTVAAAREGALRGIPALASSADVRADLDVVSMHSARIAKALFEIAGTEEARTLHTSRSASGLRVPPAPLLNLNFPKNFAGEIRVTHTGARVYEELVDFRKDPRGRDYAWLAGPGVVHEDNPGADTAAHDEGAASLTPLVLDLTMRAGFPLAERLVHSVNSG